MFFSRRLERERNRGLLVGAGIGFVAGLALGGANGVLFAPQSGKKTRKDISDKTDEIVKSVKDSSEELQLRAREVKEDLEDVADATKEDFSHIRGTLTNSKTQKVVEDKLNK